MEGQVISTEAVHSVTKVEKSAVLMLQDVSMTFQNKGKQFPILDRISLLVNKGEFVSLIGPSGSGKSTLFHLIGGLLRPKSGDIFMQGKSIIGQKGHVSYMPQQPALFPWRSVEDNVMLAQEIIGGANEHTCKKVYQWLADAGLTGYEQAYPHSLSGGMQQRVSFLRALLSPQELMLLDEPFNALDMLTRTKMQNWLIHLWEKNRRSVLLITHSIEEALLLSDTIYILSKRPAHVLQRIKVPFARPRIEQLTVQPEFMQLKHQLSKLLDNVWVPSACLL